MDELLNYVAIFAQATDIRRKPDIEYGDNLEVEAEIIEDLTSSMHGCLKTIESSLPEFESSFQGKDRNDLISINRGDLAVIRDFAGNLSLLCNMILNGKEYSGEDKREAIQDDTTE